MTETKTDALATVDTGNALARFEGNDLFLHEYGQRLLRVEQDIKTREEIEETIFSFPEEFQENLLKILAQLNPNKRGVLTDSANPVYTELKLYHGVGANPNRPEDMAPGNFFLTSNEFVGKTFEGTPLVVWESRTLTADNNSEGGFQVLCRSNDRKYGDAHGKCADCYYRPWRDKSMPVSQSCRDEVNAFMLRRNLQDIVLVRFQKTSNSAGRQLINFAQRTSVPWMRWYKIGTEERKSATDKSMRWFVMTVAPINEERVPTAIYPFCDAMSAAAERDYVLATTAAVYRKAQGAVDDAAVSSAGGGMNIVPPADPDAVGEGSDDLANDTSKM